MGTGSWWTFGVTSLDLEWTWIFLALSCSGYLTQGSGKCWVERKVSLSLSGSWNSSSFTWAIFILLYFDLCWAHQKPLGLCQDLGLGSIRFWAYLVWAFRQAQAFEPGQVPFPASTCHLSTRAQYRGGRHQPAGERHRRREQSHLPGGHQELAGRLLALVGEIDAFWKVPKLSFSMFYRTSWHLL